MTYGKNLGNKSAKTGNIRAYNYPKYTNGDKNLYLIAEGKK